MQVLPLSCTCCYRQPSQLCVVATLSEGCEHKFVEAVIMAAVRIRAVCSGLEEEISHFCSAASRFAL